MNRKLSLLIVLLVLIVIIGAASFLIQHQEATRTSVEPSISAETPSDGDIESYVKNNISKLSPLPEVLGGTFYVTRIETRDGAGVVEYEDGHNAYTADFTYMVQESGTPDILTFTIREE